MERFHRDLPNEPISLIDSRFHQNGLLPPADVFRAAFEDYLAQREYNPDSRGDPQARKALAEYYSTQNWRLDPSQFILTAGTSEAYLLLFTQFAQAGDDLLLPRPGYPLFEQIARQARLNCRFYDLRWELGWQPDLETLRNQWTERTRFVVTISPNNPTGQTIDEKSFEGIARLCREKGAALICDEVFDEFLLDGRSLLRPGQKFEQTCVFTLNGISKKFASPDLKLSWIALSGPQAWVEEAGSILEIANDTYLSANSYSQFLLPRLFSQLRNFQNSMVESIKANLSILMEWVEKRPVLDFVATRAGIHALLRWKEAPTTIDDETFCKRLLENERVEVHPGYYYDVQEPGVWFVISLLKEKKAFQLGLERLFRFLLA